MKEHRIRILALLLALLLCGCAAAPAAVTGNTETASGKKEKAPSWGDDCLTELTLEGEYSQADWGEPLCYSYRLPQLRETTPDALEFNEAMEKVCRDAEAGKILYDSILWNRSWNGSLVSITMDMRVPYQSTVDHFVYNYDIALGRSLTQEELFERAGYTRQQVRQNLVTAAARCFDEKAVEIAGLYEGAWEGLLPLRAQTISGSNLDLQYNPCFLDAEGRLSCYSLIGTPAGAGSYSQVLCLEPEHSGAMRKTVQCDFITARLENNNVTLTFANTGLAGLLLPQSPRSFVQFGMAYPVEGLYGDYTDMTVNFVGNGGAAFLLLTDTNGCVSFCNILECIYNGVRFTAVGPMPEPAGITSFRSEEGMDGRTVYGVSEDGGSTDLGYAVYPYLSYIPAAIHNTVWYTEDGSHCLNCTMGDLFMMTWGGGGGILATDYSFTYLGMDGEGMYFSTMMTSEVGEVYGFLLTLCSDLDTFSYYAPHRLILRQTFGDRLSGVPLEEPLELYLKGYEYQ